MLLSSLQLIALGGIEMKPLENKSIEGSCTQCHFVYQAGFLPKRSWERLFSDESLSDHFGEKVEMTDAVREEFLKYYLQYSADKRKNRTSKNIDRSISKSITPIEIATLEFIKEKHENLKKEMYDSPKIRTVANCTACHGEDAKKGIYSEMDVEIPGWKKKFFIWWVKK